MWKNIVLFSKLDKAKSSDLPKDYLYDIILSEDGIPIILNKKIVGFVDKITSYDNYRIWGDIYLSSSIGTNNFYIKQYELIQTNGEEQLYIFIEKLKKPSTNFVGKMWKILHNFIVKRGLNG